jgi:hypothetical protein
MANGKSSAFKLIGEEAKLPKFGESRAISGVEFSDETRLAYARKGGAPESDHNVKSAGSRK